MEKAKQTRKVRKRWNQSEVILFVIACLGLAFLLVFSYFPMFGVVLAFKDGDKEFEILYTILYGDWVGLAHFAKFFNDAEFKNVMFNTVVLNLLMLLINFPAPIIFALLINEVTVRPFKRTVQTIANFPHFISWITFGGIILALTDMNTGIFNPILEFLHISPKDNPINLGEAQFFWAQIIITSLIKGVGWGSIVYVAAISGISQELYDAATIDGASRLQKAVKVTIPMISGTITIFLLLSISGLLGNNFEQFYILQNTINLTRSEVLATYIYKKGIANQEFSYTAAVGLFESAISFVLVVGANFVSKRLTGRGLY